MNQENMAQTNGKVIFRVVVCGAILLVGLASMIVLANMKKPPAEVETAERSIQVEVIRAQAENVPVQITGFGQVRPLDVVSISAEVSGRIIAVHSRLEEGLSIGKGETLFRIDPSDYRAARDSAEAEAEKLEKSILLLVKQMEIDSERLKTLERSRDLAQAEYHRYKKLYEEQEAVSLAHVEKQEQVYNSAKDQAAQMAKAIDLFPLQIEEAKSGLAAARSRLENAEVRLARCDVKAPFTGRVISTGVENGQYVAPGQQLLALADDSILEIHVPVDSNQARKWLRFKADTGNGWFADIEPVECSIRWTDDEKNVWKGILHRVIKFDPDTRTLTLAVRVGNNQALSSSVPGLPLVQGMFCSVAIAGRSMENVYRLPRWAVSFKDTVYLAVGNRLKTSPVEVVRVQDEEAFVAKGIKEGDLIIVTRLVDPLENSLLEVHIPERSLNDQGGGVKVGL